MKEDINKFLLELDNPECDRKKHELLVQMKCGNTVKEIRQRNIHGVISSSLDAFAILPFIIGIFFHFKRKNKIRHLRYTYYSISPKKFSCEVHFDDSLYDTLMNYKVEPQIV